MSTERYQTFWRRLVAGIVDGFIVLPLGFIENFVYGIGLPKFFLPVWLLISQLAFPAYIVFMHARYGQTLGKMFTGVIVYSNDGEGPISMRQSVIRESPFIVVTVIGWLAMSTAMVVPGSTGGSIIFLSALSNMAMLWFALEIVTMLFNDKRRAIHDFIAGTVVVKAP